MTKKIVLWFARKYVLGMVNDAIKAVNGKTDLKKWIQIVARWIFLLQSILKKLEDGQITSQEADELIQEARELLAIPDSSKCGT